jgi:predicted DNA-binding transcriptional regulator YafY
MSELTQRLFKLVELLRTQPQMNTQTLAEHLLVSERTVRRDLARLQELEISIETNPGRNGGVKLTRGALLASLRFTEAEALALALGLHWIQQAEDSEIAKAATTAFRRLEQVLSENMVARLTAFTGTFHSSHNGSKAKMYPGIALNIAEAIRLKKSLELRYSSPKNAHSIRLFDPYGIVLINDHLYTVGFCHLRQAIRTFRLDRLQILQQSDQGFTIPKDFDAFGFVSQTLAQAPFPGEVICRVHLFTTLQAVTRIIPATAATLEPITDGVVLTTRTQVEKLNTLALHLLNLDCAVQVLEPIRLRQVFQEIADRATKLSLGHSA